VPDGQRDERAAIGCWREQRDGQEQGRSRRDERCGAPRIE